MRLTSAHPDLRRSKRSLENPILAIEELGFTLAVCPVPARFATCAFRRPDDIGGTCVIQHPDGSDETPVIDASVHIFFKSNKDLRKNFMREPYRSRGFPDYEMDWYGAPGGEYARRHRGPDRQYPGFGSRVRRRPAVRRARRRRRDPAPDDARHHARPPSRHRDRRGAQRDDGVALARRRRRTRDRFRGTIRVNPDDITGALREIAKYKDHPRVVQIGVPLQSRELYGKPQYWPLWEAAVDGEPSGRGAHRGRGGRLVRADAVGRHQDLRAVRQLHGAELPVPPDEHDRRRGIREDARR